MRIRLTDTVRGFASEQDLKIAMKNDTYDRVLLALLFSPDARDNHLEYKMRWRNSIEMNTDYVFSEYSRPRNVNGPSVGEEKYLWPLMYAVFTEHLSFFRVRQCSVRLRKLRTRVSTRRHTSISYDWISYNWSRFPVERRGDAVPAALTDTGIHRGSPS